MIDFNYHGAYLKEVKLLDKKYPALNRGIEANRKLLVEQFEPIKPESVIAPSKIHRLHAGEGDTWAIWKLEIQVNGLRPGEWPRCWVLVSGDQVYYLHIATHQDNYDNKKSDRIALDRAGEYI